MNVSFVFAVGLVVTSFPPDLLPELFLIENKVAEGVVKFNDLVHVSFDDKGKLSKEVVLSKAANFFYGFSRNSHLVQRRFIVSQDGIVVDLLKKDTIRVDEANEELIGVEGDKIFLRHDMHAERLGRPDVVSSFNLRTGKVENVGNEHWRLRGEKSPDKTMSVGNIYIFEPGQLKLHRLGKPPVDLGGEFGFAFSPRSSSRRVIVPCAWVAADRILTIRTSRQLVTVDLKGKVEPFCEVAAAPEEVITAPTFWRDPTGRLLYYVDGADYIINVNTKTATAVTKYSLGHKFETSVAVDKQFRSTVYYDGKEIGKWRHNERGCKTAPGLIALEYHESTDRILFAGSEGGVAIWSQKSQEWQTISLWSGGLIGWNK